MNKDSNKDTLKINPFAIQDVIENILKVNIYLDEGNNAYEINVNSLIDYNGGVSTNGIFLKLYEPGTIFENLEVKNLLFQFNDENYKWEYSELPSNCGYTTIVNSSSMFGSNCYNDSFVQLDSRTIRPFLTFCNECNSSHTVLFKSSTYVNTSVCESQSCITSIEVTKHLMLDGIGDLTIDLLNSYLNRTFYTGRLPFNQDNDYTTIEIMGYNKLVGITLSFISYITTVIIHDSVTILGDGVFSNCEFLKNVYFIRQSRIKFFGKALFLNCLMLSYVNIPTTLLSIGEGCFDNCKSLSNINLPDTLLSIQSRAFTGTNSLTSITIPNSVNKLDRLVFYNCVELTEITILNSNMILDNNIFSTCTSLKKIVFGSNNRNKLIIPTTVTNINICGKILDINNDSSLSYGNPDYGNNANNVNLKNATNANLKNATNATNATNANNVNLKNTNRPSNVRKLMQFKNI